MDTLLFTSSDYKAIFYEKFIFLQLEMEKALIKGEYDSEIAILNIEQKKKMDLVDHAKRIEEEIRQLKEKQETRQNEMRDRVEIATLKVERYWYFWIWFILSIDALLTLVLKLFIMMALWITFIKGPTLKSQKKVFPLM